jgi:addiction module HigA family antidote
LAVTEAARRLGVTRQALSALLNGRAGVSAEMAIRLEAGLGTSAEMWIGMQTAFDLWKARQRPKPKVASLAA